MSHHYLHTIHNRKGTSSVKWEHLFEGEELVHVSQSSIEDKENVLPLWVADMDFRCPPAVIEALEERVAHGIYGYTRATDSYFESVVNWMARRHNWHIQKEWISLTPGVVPALFMLVDEFTKPNDKVLIQRPVYYPFTAAVEEKGRTVVNSPLKLENGRYVIDFDDLAEKTADPAVTMAILCSPHNPVGRVWTAEELTRFGEICLENSVLVIADEIHHDLVLSGHQFVPFASLSKDFADNSITCTAPSKTFNLAGLKNSNIIISNQALHERFQATLMRNAMWGTNSFGVVATEAAYNLSEPWLADVLAYIEDNYHFMIEFLAQNASAIKVMPLEGTYLAWLDCRALELDEEGRKQLFLHRGKLFIEEGEMFGPEGEGFERINIACARPLLQDALERLAHVVNEHLNVRV